MPSTNRFSQFHKGPRECTDDSMVLAPVLEIVGHIPLSLEALGHQGHP